MWFDNDEQSPQLVIIVDVDGRSSEQKTISTVELTNCLDNQIFFILDAMGFINGDDVIPFYFSRLFWFYISKLLTLIKNVS